MRKMLSIALIAAVGVFAGASAANAQYEGRQERQYQNLNRSMQQLQRSQQQQQQNQFEINQMRQDLQRNQLFTPPPSGPGPYLR